MIKARCCRVATASPQLPRRAPDPRHAIVVCVWRDGSDGTLWGLRTGLATGWHGPGHRPVLIGFPVWYAAPLVGVILPSRGGQGPAIVAASKDSRTGASRDGSNETARVIAKRNTESA